MCSARELGPGNRGGGLRAPTSLGDAGHPRAMVSFVIETLATRRCDFPGPKTRTWGHPPSSALGYTHFLQKEVVPICRLGIDALVVVLSAGGQGSFTPS